MVYTRSVLVCLYDIHGNLPALEALLADAGGDRFVLGGDYALFGGWPGETVARLREALCGFAATASAGRPSPSRGLEPIMPAIDVVGRRSAPAEDEAELARRRHPLAAPVRPHAPAVPAHGRRRRAGQTRLGSAASGAERTARRLIVAPWRGRRTSTALGKEAGAPAARAVSKRLAPSPRYEAVAQAFCGGEISNAVRPALWS